MDDYIDKMQDLLLKGYSHTEVAENLYLNYHSVKNTDEVYKLRKALAIEYQCNINDVKLIGSSHTGYAYKDEMLYKRDDPEDYDFAIINADTFVRFFHMVDIDKIRDVAQKSYIEGIVGGKLHPLHADIGFLKRVNKINKGVMKALNVKKSVSVCFYLSEKAFIDGLVKYNSKLYAQVLQEMSGKKRERIVENVGISPLDKPIGINRVQKMED